MLTISQLAKRFGLSRSTLLYYDRIGLLHPSGRSEANYRLYAERDVQRLMRINTFREAGVPLVEIRKLLDSGQAGLRATLEDRLRAINESIAALRAQQRLIATLLKDRTVLRHASALDKEGWVAVLRAAGMGDEDMGRWHVEFERFGPQAHEAFLCSLGIPEQEVEAIRTRARAAF